MKVPVIHLIGLLATSYFNRSCKSDIKFMNAYLRFKIIVNLPSLCLLRLVNLVHICNFSSFSPFLFSLFCCLTQFLPFPSLPVVHSESRPCKKVVLILLPDKHNSFAPGQYISDTFPGPKRCGYTSRLRVRGRVTFPPQTEFFHRLPQSSTNGIRTRYH
jgi:hypothetical protein